MNYKNYKHLTNDRIDFSKISGTLPLPYLVEIQTESYAWFLKTGIEEAFKDVFPISNYADDVFIEYVSYRFLEPKYDWLECKCRDLTYCAPLKVTLRLCFKNTGEIKEKEVFMGDFPLMTDSGTFIINGAERAIVSQIVRSPGAYLRKELDAKSGKYIYGGDLLPTRGTWLQFESDSKDLLSIRIERQRKMPATILLKAILDVQNVEEGNKLITDLFGDNQMLLNTLKKDEDTKSSTRALREIFIRLKPGEPYNESGAITFLTQRLFDPKRYDLGCAGRYKYSSKLGIYNRLPGRVLAEDLISADGEVVYEKGTLLTKAMVDELQNEGFFEKGAHERILPINTNLDSHGKVNIVKVYVDEEQTKTTNIIGTDLDQSLNCVTISDILATFSYFMNIIEGFGETDDIDHLGNRRIRCVGELIQNQFRNGLTKMCKAVKDKMSISDLSEVTPQQLINIRPVASAIKEFFASSQLSQFMDQTNPLAELTNKRRISALGPGGITRERASFAVRDVHYSHYGRICPIETPEGQNIGLINNLACYAKINKYGFIETPYRRVEKGTHRVLETADYLTADQEKMYLIAEANTPLDENHCIKNDLVIARENGETVLAPKEKIDYIDVSPKQIVSIAASCIPFLENDDTTRALMGANMQRQALPLLNPHAPYIGTGMEHFIAKDSGIAVVSKEDGIVKYVDSTKIVTTNNGVDRTYHLQKFMRSNQGTCINQHPIVKVGDQVKVGQILADGPAMENGELALGQNVTIAFMTWNGYNYEDAVIMSERLVKDDVYTTIHIESYDCECRNTQLGHEEYTRDVPNISEDAKTYLDERGIIIPGAEVKEGDILVGKITPKGQTEPTAEEKLLMAIFADKTKDGKDTSLRVPHGGAGVVLDVKIFSRKNGDELPPKVDEKVRVYIVQKRKISEGDKMSGRHGNKGVISRILPVEDMPFLPDGTPVDIMLNPLGVPSRMNIGQILEIHLGMAAKKLGMKIATPVFDGISNEEIFDLMNKAGLSPDGKTILYDGRTGDRFDERISVGIMYMIKLVHMVDDKLHARATGTYSIITQQPLGGKAQKGGQRFGEMEVWALEAYGAAHTLQEMMTIKSDDRVGRRKAYDAIIKQKPLPKPGMPEAFKLLTKELQALALDFRLYDQNGAEIDTSEISKQAEAEEHRIPQAVKDLTDQYAFDEEDSMDIVDAINDEE